MAKKSRFTGYAEGVHTLRQPIVVNSAKELAEFMNLCDDGTQINIEIGGGDAVAPSEGD